MQNPEEEPINVRFGWHLHPGEMEIDGDGEGNQIYSALIDFRNRRYWVSWGLHSDDDLRRYVNLRERGWRLGTTNPTLMNYLDWPEDKTWPLHLED